LKDIFKEKSGTKGSAVTTAFETLHNSAGEVSELPDSYRQSIEFLQSLSKLELQEAFLKSWLKHISLQGFKTIPQVTFKVSITSRIQLRNKKSFVLWQQGLTSKSKIFLSFGGVLVESSKSSGLLQLLKDLNAGEACLVSTYLKGPNQKQDLRSLQTLADAGAFS
ncbi:MAG: RNA methylase, partial [Bdellovibrio sp.]